MQALMGDTPYGLGQVTVDGDANDFNENQADVAYQHEGEEQGDGEARHLGLVAAEEDRWRRALGDPVDVLAEQAQRSTAESIAEFLVPVGILGLALFLARRDDEPARLTVSPAPSLGYPPFPTFARGFEMPDAADDAPDDDDDKLPEPDVDAGLGDVSPEARIGAGAWCAVAEPGRLAPRLVVLDHAGRVRDQRGRFTRPLQVTPASPPTCSPPATVEEVA